MFLHLVPLPVPQCGANASDFSPTIGPYLSNPLWYGWRMKKRVMLEPELEAIAGRLLPCERIWMAKRFERWAHELRVTAAVLAGPPSVRPKRMKRIPESQAERN